MTTIYNFSLYLIKKVDMNSDIRTRFAPSPTGMLHIGNARTAIMNWIFARHHGGKFILRIEDTDQERSTQASEDAILKDISWLGLDWNEGPGREGDVGPYRQTERMEIYQSHLNQLIAEGKLYPCYCSAEELEARRQEMLAKGEQPHYDGRCRHLTDEQKKQYESEGRQPVYRLQVQHEAIDFDDLARGSIHFEGENLSDFVVARAGGMPMYNFACVVDDHLMKISHVIRGDDHVSNTPRQILIYRALGWETPQFAHIPMILGPDRSRLSKRHGATSVAQYRESGFLPEAPVNFLSLLSWSSASGEEILSTYQLIEEFDFDRVSKAASVFDVEKLRWMNGVYIRNLDVEPLAEALYPFMQGKCPVQSTKEVEPVAKLLHEHLETLDQVVEKSTILFQEQVDLSDPELKEVVESESSQQVYQKFLELVNSDEVLTGQIFGAAMKAIQKETGVKGKNLWMPMRVALTGQLHGPELFPIVEFLGMEKCRRFVKDALK